MAQDSENPQSPPPEPEPRGFSEHTRRTSSENAHEQGWGLNEEERRRIPPAQQHRGGTDYEYGAQDFGDLPVDTRAAQAPAGTQTKPAQSQPKDVSKEADRKRPARRKTA